MATTSPHYSVLLKEIIDFFDQKQIIHFVDGTVGAGGHAQAVLTAHPEIQTYFAFDQDPTALNLTKERLLKWKDKVQFIASNFENMDKILREHHVDTVDGILLDLGVSSMQLDQAEKGFSFMREGPLDMRMDPKGDLTAEMIVNTWSEQEIGKVLRDYGEEKQWKQAARTIVRARTEKPITTTKQLADVLMPIFRKPFKSINPLTLIFQGLRICVNRELEVLEKILPLAISRLKPGGILAVISFHSLEDRIVKNIFRFAASDKHNTSGIGGVFLDKTPEVKILTKKPLQAEDEELAENPRSRSAKLRVIEKL
jgi:16S rRNA (cytosine1402-N4)-methyltransferase